MVTEKIIVENELAVIQEVISQVRDDFRLVWKLESIHQSTDPKLLNRIMKWFEFFNTNYSNFLCIYTNTIHAIVELSSRESSLIKGQTSYEFGLSLKFYKRLLNSKAFLQIDNLEDAIYLLKTSLVFSKYPGMVIRSLNKSFKILEEGCTKEILINFFESIFIKYETPYYLISNLNCLSPLEVDTLMFIIQGNNIRNYEKLTIPISRKESYILVNVLPNELIFENNVIERGLIATKLLLANLKAIKLLSPFLSASKIFEYDIRDFLEKISFWKSAFKMISLNNRNYHHHSVQEFVDYFEYKLCNADNNYSLKGRTYTSVAKAIHRWHEQLEYKKSKRLMSSIWHGVTKEDCKMEMQNDEYLFKEITNGEELYVESHKLKHCVFSYLENCIKGYSSIISLQKKINNVFEPFITIEINNKNIYQIAGKRNRSINEDEYALVEKWAEKMNFKLPY